MRQSITENHKSYFHITTSLQKFAFLFLSFRACLRDSNHRILNQKQLIRNTLLCYTVRISKNIYVKTDKNQPNTTALYLLCIGYPIVTESFGFRGNCVFGDTEVFIFEIKMKPNIVWTSANRVFSTWRHDTHVISFSCRYMKGSPSFHIHDEDRNSCIMRNVAKPISRLDGLTILLRVAARQ